MTSEIKTLKEKFYYLKLTWLLCLFSVSFKKIVNDLKTKIIPFCFVKEICVLACSFEFLFMHRAWWLGSHIFRIRTIWNFQISNVKKIYTFWYSQRLFTNLYTILQAVNYTNWTSLFCSRGFFQKIYFTIQNFKVKNQMIYTMYTYVYFLHVHPISNAYIYM